MHIIKSRHWLDTEVCYSPLSVSASCLSFLSLLPVSPSCLSFLSLLPVSPSCLSFLSLISVSHFCSLLVPSIKLPSSSPLSSFNFPPLSLPPLQRTLEGHVSEVTSCKFFPSGVVALTGGSDFQLKIWSVETGSCPRTLTGHKRGAA